MSDENQENESGGVDVVHEPADVVDNIDDIPAGYRQFYHQDGDKWKLRDISVLERALTNAKSEREKYKRDVQSLRKERENMPSLPEDFDPEKWEELRRKEIEIEEKRAREEGNFEKMRVQMEEAHKKKQDELSSRVQFLEGMYRQERVESRIKSMLVESGATKEGLDLLPERLSKRVKLEEENNAFKEVVLTSEGVPMLNSESADATIRDLVEEQKEVYPSLFKSSGATGSGASATSGAGGASGVIKVSKKASEMNVGEKVRFIKDYGQEAWERHVDKSS